MVAPEADGRGNTAIARDEPFGDEGREEGSSAATPKMGDVKCVLLDIEGTICPISFVKDTLVGQTAPSILSISPSPHLTPVQFPYALRALPSVLSSQWTNPTFTPYRDAFPDPARASPETLQAYIEELTRADAKDACLKNLQGYLWENGYETGAYATPLFPDVAPALKGWERDGVRLAIYSSVSVFAQKLLFGHVRVGTAEEDGAKAGTKRSIDAASGADDTETAEPPTKTVAGDDGGKVEVEKAVDEARGSERQERVATEDLQHLISAWFDTTNAGPKKQKSSYEKIAEALVLAPAAILFLTDSVEEYYASIAAGLKAGLMVRPGNLALGEEDAQRVRLMRSLRDANLSGEKRGQPA